MTAPSTATATAARLGDGPAAWRVSVAGQLDLASVSTVRACFESVLRNQPRRVVVDLAELDFMDSTGIALLVEVAQQVDTLELEHPSTVIRDVIERTGLAGTLRLTP